MIRDPLSFVKGVAWVIGSLLFIIAVVMIAGGKK